MSYVVKEVDGKIGIVETLTGTFIDMKKRPEKEVRVIARKLNLGSGFNGWTPDFFAGYKEPT
jgi:hypothetical protein